MRFNSLLLLVCGMHCLLLSDVLLVRCCSSWNLLLWLETKLLASSWEWSPKCIAVNSAWVSVMNLEKRTYSLRSCGVNENVEHLLLIW